MAELKPCPFCGGEAHTYTYSTMSKGKLVDVWVVHCKRCGLNYPPKIRGYQGKYEFEAIEAWNRRCEDGKRDAMTELVRCKDCVYACEGSYGLVCAAWGARTDYDMFCANGERREGE